MLCEPCPCVSYVVSALMRQLVKTYYVDVRVDSELGVLGDSADLRLQRHPRRSVCACERTLVG